jgi:hypothetical protein
LQICEGLNPLDAEAKARERGNIVLNGMNICPFDPNTEIFRVSNLFLDPEFNECNKSIDKLYSADLQFRTSVDFDATTYVDRQELRGRLKTERCKALEFAIDYLKQEISVYLLLAQRGWLAEVYVGREIPTMVKIMTGEIPAAPEALKRRVNVGLKMKRR